MAGKRNTRNNKQQKKSLPWGAMMISFAVGAFGMFLMHLKDNVPPEKQNNSVAEKKTEKKATAIEPTFDFYTLLPEMETVVPGNKLDVVTAPPPKKQPEVESKPFSTATKKPEQKKDSFLLQAGSFKSLEDAEGRRAQLAFLGIESRVQTVTIDKKDTWHRVQIGPVLGRDKADVLQKKLKNNKIETLLMRAKHS